MQQFIQLVKTRILFFGLLLSLVGCSFMFMGIFGVDAGSIELNTYRPFWLNVFFVNFTFMGDVFFAIGLIAFIIFYLKRKKAGSTLLQALLLSVLAIQLIKNIAVGSSPTLFFEAGEYLFGSNELPTQEELLLSGHTAVAFALVTAIMLIVKNRGWQLPLFTAAMLLGYSRIYLTPNNLQQVINGAITGSAAGALAVYLNYYFEWNFSMARKLKNFYRKGMGPQQNVQPV